MPQSYVKTSKYLSYLLRHHPPESMDEEGYVPVEELIDLVNERANLKWNNLFDMEQLEELVETNSKKRFAFNDDETRSHLRACQGHSIAVDLGFQAVKEPPELLYHGTAERFLEAIMQNGLDKRSRQHVHLSADQETAVKVGSRHGKPVVLMVRAKEMATCGMHEFYLSANGVWLTDNVPPEFITQLMVDRPIHPMV